MKPDRAIVAHFMKIESKTEMQTDILPNGKHVNAATFLFVEDRRPTS